MTRGSLLIDTAPASSWQDAFPLGNGRHGALVYGRPDAERVIVTHHHLTWPDAPSAAGPPHLADRLARVRDLLQAGESRRALELFTGDWPRHHPRPFHPALAIVVRRDAPRPAGAQAAPGTAQPGAGPEGQGEDQRGATPAGYRRTLSYRAGITVTRWPGWRHACFTSRVRDLVVQHITGAAPWHATVEVEARLPGAPARLAIRGRVRPRSPGDAVIETTVEYPPPGGRPDGGDEGIGGYVAVTRVTATAGRVRAAGDDAVRVTGCAQLTLLTRVEAIGDATGIGAARARARAAVAAVPMAPAPASSGPASSGPVAAVPASTVPAVHSRLLLAEHARAHAAAFGDVALDLGAHAADRRLAVGELLARQAARPDRPLPALLEKLFDSGRYLLLSASGLLPPRLTGLWQGDWSPAWSGAITLDANLGLQLAGAVSTDVPEAVDAVARLVRQQLPDWRVNAWQLFGARGIVAPAHTDGHDGLAVHFEPRWPLHMWTAGADWLLVPLLDEALARCDPRYAARQAGPALRELASFYEDFLTRTDSSGHVVFAPSYSPENEPAGWTPAAVNATMDIAAARHALRAAADAEPGVPAAAASPGAARRWRELADRLPPYRLSADGALAEWAWPAAGTGRPPLPANDDHRHVSHLYPVWPLHEITVAGTPALAAAARRALRARGTQDDSAHGYLHKALAAARLRDAGLAGQLLAALAGRGFFFLSLMSSHYPKRAVYNADAACALPGVLAELLVDSAPAGEAGPGWIELLPAVPDFLPRGRLSGARTLLGVRVSELRWDTVAGRAEAELLSAIDQEADISCRGHAQRQRVWLPAGTPVRLAWRTDVAAISGRTCPCPT
ncbi:MAG TPA: glycoside hydrolase N-terminal domain-containing protein [Trebonia sp.]|nr:glycoside hydrolase N-terminal domain-containing protein [Trebonia sp.]